MLLLSVLGYGQNLPEVVPPSPTVGALMKIEQVPVSNYTGQPNINLPLLSKQVSNNLGLGFALSYHTTGVKTTEKSGWVGTGWSLQGEAVISRSVVGIPDEYNDNFPGNKRVGIYHNGYFNLNWRPSGVGTGGLLLASDPILNRFLWNASNKGSSKDLREGAFDKELDIYQVNIFGKTARFVLPLENNSIKVKMLSNPGNLKIEPTYDLSTYTISSFKVTDTNGIQYFLSEKEQTTNVSSSGSLGHRFKSTTLGQGFDEPSVTLSSETRTVYTSSWKVKTVKRVNNSTILSFDYNDIPQELNLPRSRVDNIILKDLLLGGNSGYESYFENIDCPTCSNYNRSLLLPRTTISLLNQSITTKKLKKITVSETGERFVFTYKPGGHPEYKSGGSLLNDIDHQDKFENSIKKVVFTYSTNPYNRVFLDSFQEIYNGTGTLTHRFTYDRKSQLPGYDASINNMNIPGDMWGYAIGVTVPSLKDLFRDAERFTNGSGVTTGVLRSISYPTGGLQMFEFESNTFSSYGETAFTDEEFKNMNPNNYEVSYKTQNMTLSGSPLDNGYSVESITFTVNDNSSVSLQPTIIGGSQGVIDNSTYILDKLSSNGSVISNQKLDVDKESRIGLNAGTYRLRLFSLSLASSGGGSSILGISKTISSNILSVNTKLYYKSFKSNIERFIYGGGVRIKSIRFRDTPLALEDTKVINFDYNSTRNGTQSSGVIDGFFTKRRTYKLAKRYIFGTGTEISAGALPRINAFPINEQITYDVTEHLTNPYISLTQGADVGYQKVFVSQTGNGYSEYSYTSAKNFPTYDRDYTYPFIPVKNKGYLHGNLISEKVYSENNQLLKEVINSYIDKEDEVAFNVFTYDKDCPYYQFYSTYDDFIQKYPSPGRAFLFGAAEINDAILAQIYQNCGDFSYPVFRQLIPQYHSRYLLNKKISKDYFYPSLGSPVVAVTEENYNFNSRDLLLSKTVLNSKDELIATSNKYAHEVGNSRLISENRITTPIETKTSKVQGLSETVLSKQNTTFRDFGYGFYSPNNIQTSKGSQALKTRVVYHSYDSKGNPTEVSKADGTSVVYIWGYHQTKPIAKIEGAKLKDIPASVITNIQNDSNDDYDLKDDSDTKEAELRSALNNLRNLTVLKDAQVTTFTYDPHVGVTSITDPRGETLYYHYDEFNRLELIKNSDGHIVTEHQYNYKN